MKLFLLLLLLCGTAVAEGPNFRQKDTFTQQEFDNVYSDLRKVNNKKTFDSITVSTLTVLSSTSLNGLVNMNGRMFFANGFSTAPTISFQGNSGMGFSRPAGNTLVLSFISQGYSTFTQTTVDFKQNVFVPTATVTGQASNYDQLYTFGAPSQFTVAVDSVIFVTDTSFTKTGTKVTLNAVASNHHILVWANGRVRNNTAGGQNNCTIFRDSTNLGDATNGMQAVGGTLGTPMSLMYLDAPGDTSSHVYEVYCKSNGTGTGHWGDGYTTVMVGWQVK